MSSNEIEEIGTFWWRTTDTSKKNSSPADGVTGLLKVSKEGETSLELHGILTKPEDFMVTLLGSLDNSNESFEIQGLLKKNGEHVLLINAIFVGGRASIGGMSYESYIADICLVGGYPFPKPCKPIKFNCLYIDLSGFEDWVNSRSISTKKTKRKFSVEYTKPKNTTHKLDGNAVLTLNFYLSGETPTGTFSWPELSLKQKNIIKIRRNRYLAIDEHVIEYRKFSGFLALITGSDYNLDWPSVMTGSLHNTKTYHTAYFYRKTNNAPPPSLQSSWITFPEIQKSIGSLYNIWRIKKDHLGPGVGLYFSARKTFKLYVEHRFVNLIWGIESLNRVIYPEIDIDPQKKKSDIILEKIDLAGILNSNEKRWLKNNIRSFEKTLSFRIYECIEAIGLDFDPQSLNKFSQRCATIRNDISHYGGERPGADDSNLLQEISYKTEILLVICNALFLREIGFPRNHMKEIFWRGRNNPGINKLLASQGLVQCIH